MLLERGFRPGIRNHVLVMSTVLCAGPVPTKVAEQVHGVVPLVHPWCNITKETFPVLSGIGKHPNVAAVIVIGLECEDLNHEELAAEIAKSGKPCEALSVRRSGGTLKTAAEAARIAEAMVRRASRAKREPFDIGERRNPWGPSLRQEATP
ncbi:MAG TPA: UxaA family hydrolase [Firmicutes bacterium]|nr:UxaA family hydrolase [Bacillota bacterium]